MKHDDTDTIHLPLSRDGVDDIVIVGGGLAGLFCALRLAPRPVTVLAAAPVGEGAASAWAQGGIAAALSPGDSIEAHLADTIAAGGGIVDARIAEIMVREASARVHDLLTYGVPFDRDLEGHLQMSREAAHSAARVVRVGGDQAGAAIMAALAAAVRATPSIRVIERAIGKSLALDECGRVAGIVARVGIHHARVVFPARAVVLATGGAGHLYAVTTNPAEAEGSGIAMAARAGAVIADAEFVQFHPTALAVGRDPAPLVTEAIRGAGAILIDDRGERFMADVHELAELAPRDIVARAIHRQIARGRRVFLDAREAIGAAFPREFPTVDAFCRAAGIDASREPIPVAPAAHYHMGGVLVDANGRSTVDGLWVCGEAASTGAHGANRLASNSLLEAVVFAARIADDLSGLRPRLQAAAIEWPAAGQTVRSRPDARAMGSLRRLMTDKVGVVRDADGLTSALAAITELERRPAAAHLANALIAAKLIAAAALARTETRGAHARSDFPAADPAQAHRSFMTLGDANLLADSAADTAPGRKHLATVA